MSPGPIQSASRKSSALPPVAAARPDGRVGVCYANSAPAARAINVAGPIQSTSRNSSALPPVAAVFQVTQRSTANLGR